MHRNAIIKLLNDYRCRFHQEAATVDRYQQFVQQHPDCFERSNQAGHVTGSAWLTNRAATHVLLTHHRKLNIWVQLGGHADGDSNPQAVALREAREESGIDEIMLVDTGLFDIDIHLIPARGNEPAHYHYDARFALQTTHDDQYTVSDESHDLEWIEISQLAEKTREPSMLRMADKWLARPAAPL